MDFINFDLAKKLKEKGYPQVKEYTLAMYNEDGEFFSLAKNLDEFEYSFDDFDKHDYVCPTISQVLDWFRKERHIHVGVLLTPMNMYKPLIQSITHDLNDCMTNDSISPRCSYEDAVLAGIECVLDNFNLVMTQESVELFGC